MKQLFKTLIEDTPIYVPLRNWVNHLTAPHRLKAWERGGRPVPVPPEVKRAVLRQYAGQFGLKVFVETGTFHGDTLGALKFLFEKMYSVELSPKLYERAKKRFSADKHIEFINGDSGREIGRIVKRLDRPALFWLDSHYSGSGTAMGTVVTPILDELGYILDAPDLGHVIVIDDARCFGNYSTYPTMEAVREFVLAKRPNVKIEVETDSIRITPVVKKECVGV